MRKKQLELLEAVDKFIGLINARLRFFIGAAIKDALALGNRSALLTDNEAQALLDIVETEIMTGAKNDAQVRVFLAGNQQPSQSETEELTEPDECNITKKQYYDIFIRPALDFIREEYSQLIGTLFVNYICAGERPAEDALTEDEKLLWNVFMMMVEIKFNAELTAAISDDDA